MLGRLVWIGVIATALAHAAPARAQGAGDEPWAQGVTDDQKVRAQALLDQGNAQFLDHKYPEALATYQQAVAVWDHPAIRFNIVRCLVMLGRSVEAYDNLEQALRYGEAPLEASVYEEALGYQKLLEGQIAEVAVRCAQDGVVVTLDGQPLLDCPGAMTKRLAPGAHEVVAHKPGFMTMTRDLVVMPAKQEAVDVALVPIETAGITVRRWSAWKPLAVVGGGAAVALGGALMEWKSSSDFSAYDRAIAQQCGLRPCAPSSLPAPVTSLESRARVENRLAVGAMAIGGAAIVAGAVMVWLDRPHTELPPIDVAPTPGGATASIRLSF
jgi:hypothetical protein